jgi:hypothetical protein
LYLIAVDKMHVRCQREQQPPEEAPEPKILLLQTLVLTMPFWSNTQEGDKLVSVTIGESSTTVIGSSMLELRRMLERLDGGQVSTGHTSPITTREALGSRQLHREREREREKERREKERERERERMRYIVCVCVCACVLYE